MAKNLIDYQLYSAKVTFFRYYQWLIVLYKDGFLHHKKSNSAYTNLFYNGSYYYCISMAELYE